MKYQSFLFAGIAPVVALFLSGCFGGYQELPYNTANPYGYSPPPNMPPGYTAPPGSTATGTTYGQAWDDPGSTGTTGAGQTATTQTGTTQTTQPTTNESPSTQTGGSGVQDYPSAAPVPGKPGFVTSPYSDDGAQIDVRGYPSGTPVKDPYTGGIFIVP